MSNGFHSKQTGRQTSPSKRSGPLPAFFLPSLILIIAGTGFIFFLLHLQGINPLDARLVVPQGDLPEFFSPSVRYWETDILSWSKDWSLDPLLVATVMQIESCGDPQAISPAGAQGLFQVMPFHFASDEKMLNPSINAQRGLAYLSQSYQKANGDITLTLAGYNGGHGQITQDPTFWPEETKHYTTWGSGIYQDALTGKTKSDTLTAWLNAGGWRLCQQAEHHLGTQ